MAYGSPNISRRDYSTRVEENLTPIRREEQVDDSPNIVQPPSTVPPLENLEVFSLKKETYVANPLRNSININFSEFVKPPIDIDIDQFFQTYREIFYDIPKRGDQSHTTLLEDSKDYIEDYVDPKDTTISILNNKIELLQERIEQEFTNQQHPYYADGSILHIAETFTGIMQNGKLREIPNYSLFLRWYGSNPYLQGRALEDSVYFFRPKGDFTPINGIPRGPIINKIEDFNDYNFETPTDILTFNRVRNTLDQIDLDQAELTQLRLILEQKQVSPTSARGEFTTRSTPRSTPNMERSTPNRGRSTPRGTTSNGSRGY